MNYFDLTILIFTAIIIFAGVRRGFLYSLVEMLSLVVGIPVSALASKGLSDAVYNAVAKPFALNYISNYLDSNGDITTTIEQLQSSPSLSLILGNNANFNTFSSMDREAMIALIEERFVRPVATALIEGLIFLLVLIVFSVIVSIIKRIVKPKKENREKPLSKTNRALGGILGAVKAALTVVALSTIAYYATNYINSDNEVLKALGNSVIINFVNQYNPVL